MSNNRRRVNSLDSNAARGNSPANDNRTNRSRVSGRENDNRDNNQVHGSPVNNQTDNSRDSRKAINLSAGNNRGSRNPASVNRGNLKADNLNLVSNPAKAENQVSNLKTASLSRANRNLVNAASEALRVCPTTTKQAGLSSLKGARTARPRQSLAKIF